MKRKGLVTCGIVLGVVVLLFILVVPAAPIWVKLGIEPVCIQGSLPAIKIVPCAQPAVTPLPLPSLEAAGPIPIIVDDDGSPDGLIALLYFLRNPLFDVRAVTVSCGEAHPEIFAPHLSQLLAGLGRADIPVGYGRATPLEGNNAFPDQWRQGSDEFWGLTYPQASAATEPVPAAELIVEIVSSSPQPVMVFVSGNHTNLAEALRLDASIAEHIRAVYTMGGSLYAPGNIKSAWPAIDNTVAEWNIWVDPVAAHEVLASGVPYHMTPLDATKQVTWTKADLPGWAASGSPEGELARDVLGWILDSWSVDQVFIWDLVAAVHATNPALCPEIPLAVDVVTTPGREQGRTLVLEDQTPNAAACLEPDPEQIKALAASILGR